MGSEIADAVGTPRSTAVPRAWEEDGGYEAGQPIEAYGHTVKICYSNWFNKTLID